MNLRDAVMDDAEPIAALYEHYVRTSVATFEEVPPGAHEIRIRMQRILEAGLPWKVAIDEHGVLLGYAYAAPYRTRSAYRYTVENSVYVAPAARRSGAGLTLMRSVIDRCATLGYRQMLAVIGDSANVASIRFHERLGFALIGTHPAQGYKQERWVDVVHMQLALGEGARSAPQAFPGRA